MPTTRRRAIGIDGCPGGWVSITQTPSGLEWERAPVDGIADLLVEGAAIGIDMPIGLLPRGRRSCDDLARQHLQGGASRVFTTPPRPVLELGPQAPNDDVQALCRSLMGCGVSRQAMNLAPRILALDHALADRPALDVVEVHPELAFATLAGHVLDRKATRDGQQQRFDALRPWLSEVDDLVAERPVGVPVVDALDALAAVWSAIRWRDGLARTLPKDATVRPFIAY